MAAAWPGVLRLVQRLLGWPGSAAEVEDVAQDVFLAAWRSRHDFRGEALWTTWVHTIAVRRARNAARARKRRERWFGRLLPALALESTTAQEPPGLEEELEGQGPSSAVRKVLAELRHADREVLVLRYLEDMSTDEIGARIGLDREAVHTRLSRARARLRKRLDAGGMRT